MVPGGIAGLKVEIESPALNAIGITTLNIFNETAIPGLGISYEDLGLSCGAQVQYQKTCVFNITNLVPMILVLEQMGIDASLIYCQHTFNVTVTDLAGQSTTQPLIFDASKVTLASADLWANTATLALKSIPSNATSVSVQYKKSTETTWQDATVSNDKTMATIAPEWSEASPYQINPDKGVFAATTYDYKLDIDGTEFTGQFTTAPGMTIANGNMDTWYFEDAWYPHSDATTGNLWATGNPGTKLIKDNSTKNPVNLTTPVEHESKQAAYLKSQLIEGKVLGFVSVTKFGAGNLFVGDFGEIVYSPQGAKVKFGKEYEFTARPTGLKLKYKTQSGISIISAVKPAFQNQTLIKPAFSSACATGQGSTPSIRPKKRPISTRLTQTSRPAKERSSVTATCKSAKPIQTGLKLRFRLSTMIR